MWRRHLSKSVLSCSPIRWTTSPGSAASAFALIEFEVPDHRIRPDPGPAQAVGAAVRRRHGPSQRRQMQDPVGPHVTATDQQDGTRRTQDLGFGMAFVHRPFMADRDKLHNPANKWSTIRHRFGPLSRSAICQKGMRSDFEGERDMDRSTKGHTPSDASGGRRATIRAARMKTADFDAAIRNGRLTEVERSMPAPPASSLAPDREADLLRQLDRAVRDFAPPGVADPTGRAEPAFLRLLEKTDMVFRDRARGHSTADHLRAAAAAIRAEMQRDAGAGGTQRERSVAASRGRTGAGAIKPRRDRWGDPDG